MEWGELAAGGVQVAVVPGTHDSIIQEPTPWDCWLDGFRDAWTLGSR